MIPYSDDYRPGSIKPVLIDFLFIMQASADKEVEKETKRKREEIDWPFLGHMRHQSGFNQSFTHS